MQTNNKKPWVKILVIALVGYFLVLPAVLMIGFAIFRHTRDAMRTPQTVVPQLVGMELKLAEAKARDAKLVPQVLLKRWDIAAPNGVIVGQEPEYGQSVPPGTVVGLELSVPDPNARAPGQK
jgi:beta-lactam-binding protein with PASTA domain